MPAHRVKLICVYVSEWINHIDFLIHILIPDSRDIRLSCMWQKVHLNQSAEAAYDHTFRYVQTKTDRKTSLGNQLHDFFCACVCLYVCVFGHQRSDPILVRSATAALSAWTRWQLIKSSTARTNHISASCAGKSLLTATSTRTTKRCVYVFPRRSSSVYSLLAARFPRISPGSVMILTLKMMSVSPWVHTCLSAISWDWFGLILKFHYFGTPQYLKLLLCSSI